MTVFEVGPGGPGAEVHVEIHPELLFHRFVEIGGVHHVAFRTPNEEVHRQWRDHIARVNTTVTPVINRFHFRSIYFREPGGVLFELAANGPGFAIDEDVATLLFGSSSESEARDMAALTAGRGVPYNNRGSMLSIIPCFGGSGSPRERTNRLLHYPFRLPGN